MRRSTSLFILLLIITSLFTEYAIAQQEKTDSEARRILSLRSAIVRGIEKNLNLKVDELSVPMQQHEVIVADSAFDPALGSSVYSKEGKFMTGMVLYEDEYRYIRKTGADASIRKRFKFGLESGLTFRTVRNEDNSLVDTLNPDYRNFLILNLSQPLLRDFGYQVNTSRIQITQNQVQNALYNYLHRAQQIAFRIEKTYFDLSRAIDVYYFRLQFRQLASDLLEGNRNRLRQGIINITEVQQAETAVADRDEDVISARQEVEIITNRLKDLLEIEGDDPLYDIPLVTEPIPKAIPSYPTRSQAISKALNHRPDLKQLHIALENQNIRITFLRNQKLPRLDLKATLGVNGLSGSDRPVNFLGINKTSSLTGDYGDAYSSMVDDDGYEWSVNLELTYPIGNRAAEARYAGSNIEKQQLLYQLKRLESGIETAVKNALVAIQRGLERVEVAHRFEKLAQTALEQEETRLENGLSDTFRILDFQDDLIGAHIRKTTALVDYHQGLAQLYRVMGGNLDRYDIITEVNTKNPNK